MLSHKVALGSSGTKTTLAYCHTVAARLHPNQLPSVAGEARQKIYDRFPYVLGNSKTTDVHATLDLLRRSAQTDVAVHMAPCFYVFVRRASFTGLRTSCVCTRLLTPWRKKQFGQTRITFFCTQVPLFVNCYSQAIYSHTHTLTRRRDVVINSPESAGQILGPHKERAWYRSTGKFIRCVNCLVHIGGC
jgi:hypothetical protein